MALKTKKVVLFIVEGPTDEYALSPVLKAIFQNEEVRFHVVHGDLTTEWLVDSTNVIKAVAEHIKQEMERYRFRRDDIIQVIHLIDTDGACIPEAQVVGGDVESIRYEDERIVCKNASNIIARNTSKRAVLHRLHSTGRVDRIPYVIYYFSRNLEHVLHDIAGDLTDDDKADYADAFADTYGSNPDGFIAFLTNSDFTVPGSYAESWSFIFQGTNSLHRHCNLHLLFEDTLALLNHPDSSD